jgi:hypothetical protein
MKFKIQMMVIATVAIIITSCKKQLDINVDPDVPSLEQGTPELIFPAGVASAAGRIGGDLAIIGGIWSQYYTQNTASSQYRNVDAFNMTKNDFGSTLLSSPWAELYSGGLNDFQFVINKAKEKENWNYYLMATVMKAYTLQVLVDIYDQVPYTEAFQGSGNLAPHFDDGYTVYKGLLAELDTALSKNFNASTNTVGGKSDFIFTADAGDWTIDPWIQFANTLKLKMFMRMVYAKPAEAEAGIKKLYADGVEFLDVDAKMDVFEDAPDKSNPFYEFNFRKLNTAENLKASVTFLSWLQNNGDPRLDDYFEFASGTTPPGYIGINQGDYENTDPIFNRASRAKVLATSPVDFISLSESHFLQAEALERFFAGVGAKEQYDAGVTEAFARYGEDAASFIAPGGKYEYPAGGSFEEKLEAIITQKWASMPGSHAIEAFFERNRTNYPKTSPVYSTDPTYIADYAGQFVYPKKGVTNGAFAKRLIWPDVEVSKNPNAPASEAVTKEVWWDVH